MSVPFPIGFEGGQTATAVRVDQPSDLPAALAALGLHAPRLVVVLIGGAGLMDARDLDRFRPLFERDLVPVAERQRQGRAKRPRRLGRSFRRVIS
jgi:hypothetical protein